MLLRSTLSNARKFFQKTVENFKSFLSGGYQRLPKSAPCNSFVPCGGGGGSSDVDRDHQQANKGRIILLSKEKEASAEPTENSTGKDEMAGGDQAEMTRENRKRKKIVYEGKRRYEEYYSRSSSKALEKEKKTYFVAKKLKELEMVNNGNVEHMLDIEEVLHYYSRLTCPAYVDIVDKFFMDMYSELLNGQTSITSRFHHSRPTLQRVGF